MPLTVSPDSLERLSAVVTGGSRGLGLLIARRLADRGCTVTIAARDAEELDRAAALLTAEQGERDGSIRTAVCDVRDRAAVAELFSGVDRACGGVDVVVANAGIIQVAPAEAVGADAFADAMGTIFFGAVHTALEALPYLRRSAAGGRLALIGSVGGLLAVPHLLPYSCAKHAVSALAEGLHAEEAGHGITVTTVHPGLMRTGSHLHAEFGGDREREFGWFSALAGAPLLSMDAGRAATRIVTAVQRRRTRVVLTPAARAAALLHGLAPVATTRLSGVAARVMPEAGGARGLRQGQDVQPPAGGLTGRLRAWGSALNDAASRRYNQ